jgi:hypothetical protein
MTLAEIERQAILRTLERTNGNKRAAASILGVYRPTLYGKLRKYKLGEYSDSAKASRKARDPQGVRRGDTPEPDPGDETAEAGAGAGGPHGVTRS